jgi:hypoxanthine phosphoribosyltransferase
MSFITSWKIREITLADLGPLTRELVEAAVKSGFRPDCVIYLETGARLLAVEACQHLGVGAVPLKIQRRGGEAKGRLARLLGGLPTWLKDLLRQLEARLLWRRMQDDRLIGEAPSVNLAGCRVLILDDAVDTGTSVKLAREWAVAQGAQADQVRVAALTVTTALADDAVDFVRFRQMCRFPWSSDSREREAYQRAFAAAQVPVFKGRPAA